MNKNLKQQRNNYRNICKKYSPFLMSKYRICHLIPIIDYITLRFRNKTFNKLKLKNITYNEYKNKEIK